MSTTDPTARIEEQTAGTSFRLTDVSASGGGCCGGQGCGCM